MCIRFIKFYKILLATARKSMKSIRRGVAIIKTPIIEFYNFLIGEFYQKMCIRFVKYYKILLATARKSMRSI